MFKYVDDSTLFEICNTNEISEAADWTSMNCMRINSKMSKEMIIRFTQDVNFKKCVPNITIAGIPVEVVKHAKLLGVILSDDLTWNMHVDSIVKKAAKRVYMLYQLKRVGIRQTDLVNVYVSVVRPVLEYACPVWHTNLPKYLSDNIEMIQKRALKSIFPNKGYDDILYDLGMCTLHERRNVTCEQYFKNMQGNSRRPRQILERHDMAEESTRQVVSGPTPNKALFKELVAPPWGI